MNTSLYGVRAADPRIQYILIIAVTIIALVGTLMLLRRTVIGTAMRAAAEDFDAVRLMGVKANLVIATRLRTLRLSWPASAAVLIRHPGLGQPTHGLRPGPERVHRQRHRRSGQSLGSRARGASSWAP